MFLRTSSHQGSQASTRNTGKWKDPKPRSFQRIFETHFYFLKQIYLLYQVFMAAGFLLAVESGGYFLTAVYQLRLRWLLLLWSTGSKLTGFSSCSMQAACCMLANYKLHVASCNIEAQQLWLAGPKARGSNSCGAWALVAPRHVGSS